MTPRQRALHPVLWTLLLAAGLMAAFGLTPKQADAVASASQASSAGILARGDALRGQTAYESRCGGCHSLDADRIGPRHRGVYGRKAGSIADFDYSEALKAAGVVWDAASLDRWLSGPEAFIPGQRMGFSVSDASVRADIIAYLKQESERR
jgi:cytochrome c